MHRAGAGAEVLSLYLGAAEGWLRYFEPDGTMVLSPTEAALREIQRAEQAEQEHQRAERLAQRLWNLGIERDNSIS